MRRILAGMMIAFFFGMAASVFAQEKAADFTLKSLSGEPVTLSSFAGKTNVLIVFGATWCPHCVKEIPALNELRAKYADNGLQILSVDIQESASKVQKLVVEKGITYTVLLDETGSVRKQYGVRGIPDNVLVDTSGTIVYRGHLDVVKIEAQLQG